MKLAIPAWFRPRKNPSSPPPTLSELRDLLAAARAEHAQAGELLVAARARLHSERTPETLEAVRGAKQRAEDLAEMLTICEADVARAEAEQKSAERAELQREATRLQALLTDRTRLDQLHEAWYRQLVALVDGASAIREHNIERRDIGYALARAHYKLGDADPSTPDRSVDPDIGVLALRLEDFRNPKHPDHVRAFALDLGRRLNPRF